VLLRDKYGTTALFCFSTQFRPALNRLRIYGPRNSLMVDILTGTLIRSPGAAYKSYLTYFIPPLKNASEYFRNLRLNVTNFIRQRLYQDFGMKELIERFYNSIRTGGPPAIPYREIILTARIMDEIFAQIYPEHVSPTLAAVGLNTRVDGLMTTDNRRRMTESENAEKQQRTK